MVGCREHVGRGRHSHSRCTTEGGALQSPYQQWISMRTMTGKHNYGWVIFSLSFTNLLVEGGIKNTVPVVYVALRDSFR